MSWRRDVYPLVDWAVLPVPSFYFFSGNEGFKPQLAASSAGASRSTGRCPSTLRFGNRCWGVFEEDELERNLDRALPPVRREASFDHAGWDPSLRLTADYLFKLDRDIYARASAGMLERAFGGVSGEVLWKPAWQNWGYRRGTELGGAARHQQLVRLRR